MIGYYVTQYGNDNTMALGVSGTPISFRLADLEGNTGKLTDPNFSLFADEHSAYCLFFICFCIALLNLYIRNK